MLNPVSMAESLKSAIQDVTDPSDAMNKFWKALKNYISSEATVIYTWAGMSPVSVPDPVMVINATLQPGLDPISGPEMTNVKTATDAMTVFSAWLNSALSKWTVSWPLDFVLSPALLIPSISLVPSGVNNRDASFSSLCSSILSGLGACTPMVTGTHGIYTGAGSFSKII